MSSSGNVVAISVNFLFHTTSCNLSSLHEQADGNEEHEKENGTANVGCFPWLPTCNFLKGVQFFNCSALAYAVHQLYLCLSNSNCLCSFLQVVFGSGH